MQRLQSRLFFSLLLQDHEVNARSVTRQKCSSAEAKEQTNKSENTNTHIHTRTRTHTEERKRQDRPMPVCLLFCYFSFLLCVFFVFSFLSFAIAAFACLLLGAIRFPAVPRAHRRLAAPCRSNRHKLQNQNKARTHKQLRFHE